MNALFLAAAALFAAYIAITCRVFRQVPKSISETYYLWSGISRPLMFTSFMWAESLMLVMPWIECSEPETQCLAFLSCAAMGFVGAACQFKQELTSTVHYTSAAVWALSAVAWCLLNDAPAAIAVGAAVGIGGFAITRRSFTFWAECACAVMMIVMIAMRLW